MLCTGDETFPQEMKTIHLRGSDCPRIWLIIHWYCKI